MQQGVTEEELLRALLGLESEVVMGGESTTARTSALAMDWFKLGRVRTLQEVITSQRRHPGAVTATSSACTRRFDAGAMGPEPLTA